MDRAVGGDYSLERVQGLGQMQLFPTTLWLWGRILQTDLAVWAWNFGTRLSSALGLRGRLTGAAPSSEHGHFDPGYRLPCAHTGQGLSSGVRGVSCL